MNGTKIPSMLTAIVAVLLSSCSNFKISPEIEGHPKHAVVIQTYSFHVETFFKAGKFELESLQITSDLLEGARRVDKTSLPADSTHLSIVVEQRSHGGACAQDYLTGLSLGLIPSWCARPKRYSFNFDLYQNGKLCSSKDYVISETTYGHIVLLPFGLLELVRGVYSEVLGLYKESLSSFVKSGC